MTNEDGYCKCCNENADRIESLRQQLAECRAINVTLLEELLRVKSICLREVGIGIVNENILALPTPQELEES